MARTICVFPTIAAVFFLMPSPGRADEEVLDSRMYHDPELPSPKIVLVYPDNLLPLWLEALKRPEADYQCRAALAIVLGHKEGLKGLDAAVGPLMEALERLNQTEGQQDNLTHGHGEKSTGSDPQALVRLAVSRALIELDAQQAVFQLFEQAQKGDGWLRALIEPALAQWDYRPAGQVWLARLRQSKVNSGDLLLAVRGLAALRELEAISPLKELVHSDKVDWPIRLEAARALGGIRTSDLESNAAHLLSSAHTLEKASEVSHDTDRRFRLAAAWLLRHHQGDEAVRLLQSLARDSEPTVALVALDRLLEIDSKLVLPAFITSLSSPDAGVRLRGIEFLFREATTDRIRLLADRLDDEHPEVRVKARHLLHDLAAKSQFRDAVIQESARILGDKSWRGLEQATLLLGQLDHKPAAKRLVELLSFERPEVLIAAGWGLRKLDVQETLPAALSHLLSVRGVAESNAKSSKPDLLPLDAWDQQLSHLAQLMGQRRYQPAETVLRTFVPRLRIGPIVGQESRAASIWALGLILEGKSEPGLTRQLEDRLNDIPRPFNPGEDPRVRRMCAIALGRMKAKETLKSIRRYYITPKPTLDPVSSACGWAIQQNTGETPPPPGTIEFQAGIFKNWLKPIPESKPKG